MGVSPSVNQKPINLATPIARSVKNNIEQNCVMIYSKTYCSYCTLAKKVFDDIGQPYGLVEINKHPEGTEIEDVLDLMTGSRKVPRVFVNGKCIGGGLETRNLHKSGELLEMLKMCNVEG